MPFYNFAYTANRLFPVSLSNANVEFRIWINNGTSIDRVISVSKDKDFGDEAYLTEIGKLTAGYKSKNFYTYNKMIPKSGVDGFIAKIDSLKLSSFESQPDSDVSIALHNPFSLYVVELKENGKYHCFRFITNFPNKENVISKYTALQNLIASEFPYNFHMQ